MEDLVIGNAYKGKRALITGVSGFKGAWLAVWLRRLGAEVVGLSLAPPTTPSLFEQAELHRDVVRWVQGDVRDASLVQRTIGEQQPDVIFHLAAQSLVRASYEDPVGTFSTNVMGTIELLEAVRRLRRPVAIVVVTSDKCYENRERDAGYVEGDALGGHDPYSASKGCAEIVTSSYRRSFFDPNRFADHGVAVASARAGNVIGAGDWAKDRIVPDAIASLRAGRAIPVRNPHSIRPWQHVLESLSGYLTLGAALMGPEGSRVCSAFNFGPAPGDTRTVAAVVDAIIGAWGSGSWDDLSVGSAVHEASLLRLDIAKARSMLDWHPTWNMERAVSQTVAGYRACESASAGAIRDMMNAQIGEHANNQASPIPMSVSAS